VKAGEVLLKEIIAFKRTEEVSNLSQIETIDMIGRSFLVDLKKDTVLKKEHLGA